MNISDLNYILPEDRIALTPKPNPRVLLGFKSKGSQPNEIQFNDIFNLFEEGDVLVINETLVSQRKVQIEGGAREILFLNPNEDRTIWDVLFAIKKMKIGDKFMIAGGVECELLEKGRPQKIKTSEALTDDYFKTSGRMALPPYIETKRKKRGEAVFSEKDLEWYQTPFGKEKGSLASPTASLHFAQDDIDFLKNEKKVEIAPVTLHVGMGTFQPIDVEDLNKHEMHAEFVKIQKTTIEKIVEAKKKGNKVWALGTTAMRAVESWATDSLDEHDDLFMGDTYLFIKSSEQIQVVDCLLTNFHQPCSTLLALVASFSGVDQVKAAYTHAVEQKFRFLSYGDLSVWYKNLNL